MASQGQPLSAAQSEVIRKKTTPLPRVQIIVLLYLQLAEPITSRVMLPFIVQLIQETGITRGDVTKVGYYTGLIDSLFFAAEALCVLQWCGLSDHIGRRPVLLTGLVGLALSMLCFGLSHTFWAVVASRAIAGVLNGNTGVIKCMMSEITDESNMARAFSFMPIIWSLGNTIAPLLGGWLQHPYENIGGFFRKSTFWKHNPYFLPCIVVASYSISAFVISYFLLKETAPLVFDSMSNEISAIHITNKDVIRSDRSLQNERSPLLPIPKIPSTSLQTLLTRRVLVVIINYAILATNDITLTILMPLFLSTPIYHGGLGMEPGIIGACLSLSGIANCIVTLILFPRLCKTFREKRIFVACVSSFLAIFLLFPIMNSLARANGRISLGVWILFCVQIMLRTLITMGFSTIFMYLTAAPTRFALGATNGLAQTTTSIMRAIGPMAATSLFAATMSHGLLGGTLVYVVLCITGGWGVATSFLLPDNPWPRSES